MTSCGQYDEEKCGTNNFAAEEELNSILKEQGYRCGQSKTYGAKCWKVVDCRCSWNSTAGKCQAVSIHKVVNETNEWYDPVPAQIKAFCNPGGET